MSNYTKSTNFATKDNLTPGDPLKVVRGTEIDTEYNDIATAIATKTDGAASSTDNAIARFDSTTGKIIQNSVVTIADTTGDIVGTATQGVFNTVSTTVNAFGAATAVNLGAATGTATVNNTTLAAKAITASTTLAVTGAATLSSTLAVTGTSTLTGAVTATAGVTGPLTSSSVSITGGSITGITDLAVADGGTGASTAAGGLNNLLPSQTGNASKYLQTDGTNASWDAVSLSTADITGTLGVANGGTGVTTSTGTTNVVLSNSPTLVTPVLGVATATSLQGIIGNVTPAAGSFTTLGASSTATLNTLSSSGATLTGGTINGMTVGATTATTGAFTTVTASTAIGTASGGTGLGGATPFTANGVVYASSSSALATGSALYFDGTNLGVGTTSPISYVGKVVVNGHQSIIGGNALFLWDSGNANAPSIYAPSDSIAFKNNAGSELMRINATGLGIGTSSPDVKLSVVGDAKVTGAGTYSVLTMIDATASGSAYAILSGFPALGDFTIREAGVGNHLTIKKTSGNAVFGANIGIGGTTPTTSGTGITFPATQSASSNANTLDDYEEGTFTPVLQGSTTSGTYTYDTDRTGGNYTKIGNTVYIRGVIRVSGTTSAGSGDAQIANLPFPSINVDDAWGRLPGSLAVQSGPVLVNSSIFVHTDGGSTSYLGVGIQGTTTWTRATVAEVGTTDSIWFFEIQYNV